MNPRLPFQVAVAKQVIVNGAVGEREPQTRRKNVLELFADQFGIGLFDFHDEIQRWSELRNGMNREAERKLTAES